MKGTRGFGPVDLGTIFDEIFEAARDFQDEFRKNFNGHCQEHGESPWCFDENTDYYPNYSYPPMNIYMTSDRSLIFEFALAGFEENDISLSFQGDYMVFQAVMSGAGTTDGQTNVAAFHDEGIRYFKRRLKMKAIEKQKYFVPMDKYAQEKVKAVFRNGILKVTVPPKEEPEQNGGIKIEIIT
jgi:HSP20 family molecular chaperone IbpA